MFLRQSTASQEILLGTFVNDEDGNTAETGLTIGVRLAGRSGRAVL